MDNPPVLVVDQSLPQSIAGIYSLTLARYGIFWSGLENLKRGDISCNTVD